MSEIDTRLAAVRQLYAENETLLLEETLSEADVRAKIIDRLFCDGLGWPEKVIRREQHTVSGGFIDYRFGDPRCEFLLEAKKAAVAFKLPASTHQRTFSLKNLARQDATLEECLRQVARYCQDQGYEFGVVFNGHQLLVFKAHRTGMSWLDGEATVFRSAAEIVDKFGELWDLLSYPAVTKGSLHRNFAYPEETPKHHKSVISSLQNPDEKLVRNYVGNQLISVSKTVFEDLTDHAHLDAMEKCYVYSQTLQTTADSFILAIKDLPPSYLKGQIQQVIPEDKAAGAFPEAVRKIQSERKRGEVLLLLGGVGAGKTTFLKRVQVKYCASVLEQSGQFLYVDFRTAPERPPFHDFVFSRLREQLNGDPSFVKIARSNGFEPTTTFPSPLDSPRFLGTLFNEEISRAMEVAREMGVTSPGTLGKRRLAVYEELTKSDRTVVTKAFRAIESAGRFILLALDNADQLPLEYQLEIFLFAQHLAAETGANIVLALREEKYYLASQQGAFNAFHTHAFHIPSPSLRVLLSLRIEYALERLSAILPGESESRIGEIHDYLDAIRKGGVGTPHDAGSSNVVRLLERICHGNMRRALTIFRSFLQSGNTHVDKIISIYRENASKRVPYHVPFHEFVKAVMLGDRRYYRETASEIINLFAISGQAPNSHFTATRILFYLLNASERGTSWGKGFVEISELLRVYSGVFPDASDCSAHLLRLLSSGLVESDTGITDDAAKCNAVRVGPAGEYYLKFLAQAFAYLDLVCVDTPISDSPTFTRLRELVERRDKEGRFERVDLVLKYLSQEEAREYRTYVGLSRVSSWSEPMMPGIISQIAEEKKVISANFARANERYEVI